MIQSVRLLHVDDEPDVRDLTATFLEREDDRFNIETVASGSEALSSIEDRPPDCVVSDYNMPGMDGLELLQAVREEYPDLPFILFTGKGSEAVASEAIAADVTDYLQKGPGAEKYALLANRIRNAVRARREAQRVDRQEQLMRLTEFAGGTGGFELDVDTGEVLLTDGARQILGVSEQKAANHEDGLDNFHEDDRDKIQRTIRRALQTNEQTRGTWRYQSPGGDKKLLDITYTPVTDNGDEPIIRGAINDVTDRQERQQELRRLQQAIDDANVSITLADPSQPDEPLVYVNDAFEEMTGYPPDETLGRNCRFLQGEETNPEKITALREAIDSEEPVTVELRNYRKDGTEFWNRLTVNPIYDDDGQLVRYLGTQEDITERKERKRELEQQRQRLTVALEGSRAGVWEWVPETDEVVWHESTEQLFGLEPGTFEGTYEAFAERVHDDDLQILEEAIEEALPSRDPFEAEYRIHTDSGDELWIRARGEFADIDGLAPRYIGVITDITDRKQRERELERTTEWYRTLLDTAPDAVFVADAETGVIRETNQAATRLLGRPREEIVGMHQTDLHPPEKIEEYAGLFEEHAASGGGRDETLGEQVDIYVLDGDGNQTPVEINSRTVEIDGERLNQGYFRDITDRKQREQEIQNQREQMEHREEKLVRLRDYTQKLMYAETPAETADIALRAIDETLEFKLGAVFTQSDTQDGLLELIGVLNQSQMEKMYGGLPMFVRDAPAGTHSALAWQALDSGESVFINDTTNSDMLARKSPFGSLMMYPIGQHGIMLLAATRLDAFTETEEILLDLLTTALQTAFDRLDREQSLRRQRDELKRQNEHLEEFASVVSHDLRNPLRVADGRLELAQAECDSPHLDDMGDALDRMDALIEDLLTLAWGGETVGSTGPVSLSSLIEKCWEVVPEENATLTAETDRTVSADRSPLRQLFENLLANAVEHGGEDVTVRVGDLADGFFIADDGVGIPEGKREDVFEPGYSTDEEGTGFGLRIVKQVVDAHGWEIRVTDSDDGGARFEITGVEISE